MPMAARKEQPSAQKKAEVIPIMGMPRLPQRLKTIMEQGSEKVSPQQLRSSMLTLNATLSRGTFSILQGEIRRYGRGWGWSNQCMICGELPPDWMHQSSHRRKWQSSEHLKHAVKGETRANFEVYEGDVTKV